MRPISRFGPFFALDQPEPAAPGWLPVGVFGSDSELLAERIAAVRQALATSADLADVGAVPPRVAASITQSGLCARLVAPALALATDGSPIPAADRFVFRDELGGAYPLGLRSGPDPDEHSPIWPESMLNLVRPICAAVLSGGHGLSARIVWGNVASGLAGAAAAVIETEPASADRAEALLTSALCTGELRGTGEFVSRGRFRRQSCCLIYQLSDQTSLCGDCVLAGRH